MKEQFLQLNKDRRSTHFYEAGFKLSETEIRDIVEPVRFTPSGYNAQPWQFLVIQEDEKLIELQKIALNQPHVTQAGNVIIVLGDKEFGTHEVDRICTEWAEKKKLPPARIDGLRSSLLKGRDDWKKREMMIRSTSLAAMNLLLSIEANGFVACPMMGIKQMDLRKFLDLPDHILPVLFITVGKSHTSKNDGERLPRKSFESMCWKEKFGESF